MYWNGNLAIALYHGAMMWFEHLKACKKFTLKYVKENKSKCHYKLLEIDLPNIMYNFLGVSYANFLSQF